MIWDESISGRGGNEVALCIVKWVVKNVDGNINNYNLRSCQNRNMLVVMSDFWMMNIKSNLQAITHKFLAEGHTQVDVIIGIII